MLDFFDNIADLVVYLSGATIVLIVALWGRLSTLNKYFACFVTAAAVAEIYSYWLGQSTGQNLVILHIYTVVELLLLTAYFKHLAHKMDNQFPFIPITAVVSVLCVLNSLFIQPTTIFNSYSATLQAITLIFYCLVIFYMLVDQEYGSYTVAKWAVSSLLLYHLVSLLVLAASNIFLDSFQSDDLILWLVRAIVSLIVKVIWIVAIIYSVSDKKIARA